MESVISQGRSLEETPTWSVASVTTVMVFVCFIVERSIYRFGKWLKKTRRKALSASLEKIKEDLMLLGLISLLLGQWASWISQICVDSSLLSSRFYVCSEKDYDMSEKFMSIKSFSSFNETNIPPKGINHALSNQCGEGREPFVSYEGLEQLHRFLFVLGITHVLYSCVTVGLAMSKIYSWRKWENQATLALDAKLQAKVNKVMNRQSTFVLHHASHPWSRSRILIWMLCFLRQFKRSIQKSDYLALRMGFITVYGPKHGRGILWNCGDQKFYKSFKQLEVVSLPFLVATTNALSVVAHKLWPLWGYAILCIFINIHGLNIYFWLSFIPVILVMLVGTKLQHVVSLLALETVEPKGKAIGTQVKPRDDLFWFGKPEILLRLIQFISFQNAFEMATFIWSWWGFKQRSCFMKNHVMICIRLVSGVLVQFWCSYSTVPLNVLITQMGSKCKKAVIAESVRESLHSWCKRVKERSKRDALHSVTIRSTCSLESTIDERDEIITVGSGTLSRCSSAGTLDHVGVNATASTEPQHELSFRIAENPGNSKGNVSLEALHDEDEGAKVETLLDLFQKT